ncbi:MAG: ribosome-associated protein [Pseudomonadota bacterium]
MSQEDEPDWDDADQRPSKSQRKREHKALHDLAERLTGLADSELERLGIGAAARKAVAEIRRIPASGARQRQIKYAARLLGDEDTAPAQLFLDDRQSAQLEINQRFHALERWRDRLVGEGDAAVTALLDEHPEVERQQLRQLVRAARAERDAGKPPAAARKLFRFLREQLGP